MCLLARIYIADHCCTCTLHTDLHQTFLSDKKAVHIPNNGATVQSHSVSHYFQDASRGVCDTGDGSNSPAVSLLIVMSSTLSSPRWKQPIK